MSGGDSAAAAAAASPQPLPFSLPKPPPLMQLTPGDAVRPVAAAAADQSPKGSRLAGRPDWPAGKPVSLLAPLLPPRGEPEPLMPFGPSSRQPLRGRLLGRCGGGSLLSPAMRPGAVDRGSLMVSAGRGGGSAGKRGGGGWGDGGGGAGAAAAAALKWHPQVVLP